MQKSFVTVVPNKVGAFLKATRIFGDNNVNIIRVSYNKAVDSHYIFIDAEGKPEALEAVEKALNAIDYLTVTEDRKSVVLLEFKLEDHPGVVTKVLELIEDSDFNISYLSSQQNGTAYQLFKMGLFMEEGKDLEKLIKRAEEICEVRILDYNKADRVYDNSIFYTSFLNELVTLMPVGKEEKAELMININLAMQILDETGVSPFKTFDSISHFTELLSSARGERFTPRVTRHQITGQTELILIEPQCGSNTAILHSGEEYLFVDSGYACYRQEMLGLFYSLIPDFDDIPKRLFLTHADVDHGGLMSLFDEIYCSAKSAEDLRLESCHQLGFREQNPLHMPYIKICKALTGYPLCNMEKVRVVGEDFLFEEPLVKTGVFYFGDLEFTLFEGKGGHLRGESVLVDYKNHIAFTGDVFVNMKDMTPAQALYNTYAPILMTSVDTDKDLCAEERKAFLSLLTPGMWSIFGGHGGKKTVEIAGI